MKLHHIAVGDADAPRLAFVLHGALGAGHNFRSFIKRLATERPAWRFVLVDLRNHGHSQGAPSPQTVEACVDDLAELAEAVGRPPNAVIGHSFGGKVALAYARRALGEGTGRPLPSDYAGALDEVWALDSDPGTQTPDPGHEVLRVLEALRRAPGPFSSRNDATAALTGQGLSSGLANWLGTNLERSDSGFAWRLDVEAIGELMQDYFREDLWPFVETVRERPTVHLVVAEHSDRWTGDMRSRAGALPEDASVELLELPNAGHWVHVDNPDGLLALFNEHMANDSRG